MGQDVIFHDFNTSLEEILRKGAQQLLQQAIENEVQEYLNSHRQKDVKAQLVGYVYTFYARIRQILEPDLYAMVPHNSEHHDPSLQADKTRNVSFEKH